MSMFLMLRSGCRAPARLSDREQLARSPRAVSASISPRDSAPSAAARSRLRGTSRVTHIARGGTSCPPDTSRTRRSPASPRPGAVAARESSSSRGARVAPRTRSPRQGREQAAVPRASHHHAVASRERHRVRDAAAGERPRFRVLLGVLVERAFGERLAQRRSSVASAAPSMPGSPARRIPAGTTKPVHARTL